MSTEPYVPIEGELIFAYSSDESDASSPSDVMELEAETRRGIAKIKADALREAAEAWRKHLLTTDASYVCAESWLTVRADRVEEEA